MPGMRRNAWADASLDQCLAEGRRTVGPIDQQGVCLGQVLDHCGGGLVIVGLPFSQVQHERASFAIADHLQLGGQSASAASDTSG